jgi:hypothetical protein
MKKIRFLFGLLILNFHAFGQIQKIEKRSYGLLDTNFYVNGRDTVYIETFHHNGLLHERMWKEDSTLTYDNRGKLKEKVLTYIKHDFGYFNRNDFEIYNNKGHKEWEYYPDGRLLREISWQGDTLLKDIKYTPNGSIIETDFYTKHKAENGLYHEFYYTWTNNKGRKTVTTHDTLSQISTDSLFDEKGKLTTFRKEKLKTLALLEHLNYREDGSILYHWQLDSNRLHPDKDNGDCVYGFRNLKGDWIHTPQYDNIKFFNKSYFIVNKNQKYSIVDDFGKTILPFDYDYLGSLTDNENEKNYFDSELPKGMPSDNFALKYRLGEKYGVIDFRGQILLPPQYDNVRSMKGDTFEVKIGKKWGLVNSKGSIIVQPNYYDINHTQLSYIFETVDTFTYAEREYHSDINGLVDNKGKILLDSKFSQIKQDEINPTIFHVSRIRTRENNDDLELNGIFDIKKGWLLDTTYYEKDNGIYVLLKQDAAFKDSIVEEKYGYVNNQYDIVLPFVYDFIGPVIKKTYNAEACEDGETKTCNRETVYFICKKDNKFGLFDKTNNKWLIQLKYDYIEAFIHSLSNDSYISYENDVRFLALKDGKWRWIDANDSLLSNDLMDYAGKTKDGLFNDVLFTIKDNQITLPHEDYFPQTKPFQEVIDYALEHDNEVEDLIKFEDFKKGEILANRKGVVVVPSQFSIISWFGKHAIVKDEKGNQWDLDVNGKKRPFLQQYKIELAQIEEGIVIVQDTLKKLYGVVSPEGKVVLPIRYFAISALDTGEVLWVQEKESQLTKEEKEDEKINSSKRWFEAIEKTSEAYILTPQDNNWLMFNKKGQQISKNTFAFPINLNRGHGIGAIRLSEDGKQFKTGLWRADGTNILPPQYDRIFFDDFNRLYFIYKKDNKGWKVGICDSTGRIVVEPKYERMGVFNGNYALVQEEGRLGLIMRNGQLKITPQYNAFKNTPENIEALLCTYVDSIEKNKKESFYIPLGFHQLRTDYGKKLFDSLNKDESRILKNLIIEKLAEGQFIDGKFVPFDRSPIRIFSKEQLLDKYMPKLSLIATVFSLANINCNKKSMGFTLGDSENRMPRSCGNRNYNYKTYNYLKTDNGSWYEVHIEDILTVSVDNSFKINQLIINKIRDLKDANIDCSNSASYFEQVKEKFYIYPEGLKFFLSRGWWQNDKDNKNVEVLLTWNDLKGFLRK